MTIKNAFAIPQELRDLIIERFDYDPLEGKIYFKERRFINPTPRQKQWNIVHANKEAGFLNTNGYIRVSLEGKQYYAHQIAFIIMTGYLPIEVEHKDKNKINNKWENLREATHSQNSQNVFKRLNNKSGYKGVSWSKSNNMWRMDIGANGVKHYSYHSTPEEAYKAYILKSKELHGEFGYYDND